MSEEELPGRVRRAFRDRDAFEPIDERTFEHTGTAFEGEVEAAPAEEGRIAFDVTVTVPMLDAVTADDVAAVVEEGWLETFELRVEDVGSVTRKDRDLTPRVRTAGDEIVVEVTLADIDERRGVHDAAAFVEYVEGTYVQGIIPGYDYTDPVASLISKARQTGGSDAGSLEGSADGDA